MADSFEARLAAALVAYAGERVRPVDPLAVAAETARVKRAGPLGATIGWRARWLAAAAVVVAGTMAALIIGGGSTGPSPSPAHSAAATAGVAASSPTPDPNGPCHGGAVRFVPVGARAIQASPHTVAVPSGSLIAFAAAADTGHGSVLLADGSTGATREIVTYTGSEVLEAVQVLDWTADGRTLLVAGGHPSLSVPERDCHNLFLVAVDGSQVAQLTDNGPGDSIETQALAPNGTAVAYVQSGELHVVDATGAQRGSPAPACGSPQELVRTMAWSPNGALLAVTCDRGLRLFDAVDGSVRDLAAPGGDATLAVRWSADGAHLVAVTAPATSPQSPLRVYDVEVAPARWSILATSDASADWVSCCPAPAISPDGHWVIALDGGVPDEPAYRVDVRSGTTRAVSVLDSLGASANPIAWLPSGTQGLIGDGSKLILIDVAQGTSQAVGLLPTRTFVWRPSTP